MFPDIITTEKDLRAVVDYFMQFDAFAFDTESMGEHRLIPAQSELAWISLATHGAAVAIPFGHPNGDKLISKATRKKNQVTKKFDPIPAVFSDPPEQLRPSQVFDILRPLFFSNRRKIGANLPFDVVGVKKYFCGETMPGPFSDVLVDQWLLNENLEPRIKSLKTGKYYNVPKRGLKELTEHYFGVKYDTEEVGKDITKHLFSTVGRYAVLDAKYTWLLWQLLAPQMEPEDLLDTLETEEKLIGPVCRMSAAGAPVNRRKFEELQVDFARKKIEAEADIYRAAGRKFDIGSVPQKQEILYGSKRSGGQGLKPIKLTPAGKKKKQLGKELTINDYSTDAESLEAHADNQVVQALSAHSEVDKLLGYLTKYLGDPLKGTPSIIFDGRIYAQFKQYGTVTGRFSSSEPNLQNIPAHGENAKGFREGFEAPDGFILVVADYGQIELRVLAHYIGHGRLYDGFMAGIDAHTSTAAAVFGVAFEDVTKEMRQVAKGLNFAIVYGAGAAKVASMAGITLKQAKEFLARHAELFPEIHEFTRRVVERCRKREFPHIRTMSGQFRRLPEIARQAAMAAARRTFKGERYNEKQFESRVWAIQSKAERQAVNSLIQGSAAYLIKLAMIRVDDAFEKDFADHGYNEADRIQLCLTVHDELMAIAPEHRQEDAKALLKEAMLGEGIQKLLRVPLDSDVKAAKTWAEAK
ncbi:DNA polymerase [Streptomyces sp. NPDC005551]|uniref:DNA polymerase n=1 Tax=Streptomyces sp. NPDC005551 TaxID=3364725 RepID=UPI00369B8D44